MSSVFNLRDYGAVGDGLTDDSGAFENALMAASSAGGGTVWVPAADYVAAFIIPSDVTVMLGRASILPPSDANIITLKPGSSLVGPGAVKCDRLKNSFTKACVYLDGSARFQPGSGQSTSIRDIAVRGAVNPSGSSGGMCGGSGIHLFCDGGGDLISGVHVEHVNVSNVGNAIRLESIASGGDVSRIVGNVFNDVFVEDCDYHVRIIGDGEGSANEVGMNSFSHHNWQCHYREQRLLQSSGYQDTFSVTVIWDTHRMPDGTHTIELTHASSMNQFLNCGGFLGPWEGVSTDKGWIDNGTGNIFSYC